MGNQFDKLSKSLANGIAWRKAQWRLGPTLTALVILAALTASQANAQTYTVTVLGGSPGD